MKAKSVVSSDNPEIERIADMDEDMRIIDGNQTYETTEESTQTNTR
jgi:hypothetical protein